MLFPVSLQPGNMAIHCRNQYTYVRLEHHAVVISRHLEDFDRSDPNLCFRYAVHLHKLDLERSGDEISAEFAEDAIHWADVALENKAIWPAGPYKKNVYHLMKLRAEAGARLWQSAAERYAQDDTRENEAMTNEYKGMAMSLAREWLDYARASKQPSEKAMQLCASAAGTIDACR